MEIKKITKKDIDLLEVVAKELIFECYKDDKIRLKQCNKYKKLLSDYYYTDENFYLLKSLSKDLLTNGKRTEIRKRIFGE